MAGLENIINQIRADARSAAAEITEKAQQQADNILAQARADAENIIVKSEADAKNTAQNIKDRAASAADLERRKRLLEEKQAEIAAILTQAQQMLEQLPDAEYFAVLRRLAARYALPQTGEILVSQEDFSRLPEGFAASLELPQGGCLKAEPFSEIQGGGFLLRYGGIEVNCTFPALFEAAREDLQDKIYALLFAGK